MDQLDVLLALGLMGRPNGYLNGGSGCRRRRDLPSCHGPQPPRWRAHLYFSGSSSLLKTDMFSGAVSAPTVAAGAQDVDAAYAEFTI